MTAPKKHVCPICGKTVPDLVKIDHPWGTPPEVTEACPSCAADARRANRRAEAAG